jgi:peptide/nickel transport system permease protein
VSTASKTPVRTPVRVSTASRQMPTRGLWARATAYPRLALGALILFLLVVTAVLAPVLAPFDPKKQDLNATLALPDSSYVLGTDHLGRDILSRSFYGGQLALEVAIAVTIVAVVIGVFLGLLSGFRGGWIDSLIMRFMDGFIVFPDLILALAITYALGPSFGTVVVAIAITQIPQFARIIRSQVLSLKEREFIASATVSGASNTRVLMRHLLPNTLEVVVVQIALTGGKAIFTAASLSFLGLGLPPSDPDWGGMLKDGFAYLGMNPLMSIVPGVLIFLSMLSFNLLGDGLRDMFDPKVNPRLSRGQRRASTTYRTKRK